MKWGQAAEHRNTLEARLVVLEEGLDRLDSEMQAAQDHRLTLADLIDRRAAEAADRLTALAERIERLEGSLNDTAEGDLVDGLRLAEALSPLKLEIAAIAHQAAVDERQAQRAYLELVAKMERLQAEREHPDRSDVDAQGPRDD